METKHLFSKGVLWRKCLAYVKHMLSMSRSGSQPQAIVSLSGRSNGTEEKATQVFRKSRVSSVMVAGMTALFMLFSIGVGNAWGEEVVAYTLTCPANSSNNNYGTTYDATVGGITWNAHGNQYANGDWRMGGKSISSVNRRAYSKTQLNEDITKIIVAFGAKSNSGITVNSVKFNVYSTAALAAALGNGDVSTHTLSYSANGSQTITVPSGKSWNGRWYSIIFNVTVSGGSNKYVALKSITFYKEDASCSASPTVGTVSANGPFNWSAHTFPLSVSSIGAGGDGCAISEYGFVWNANTDPTISNNKTKIGESSSATSFTGNITNASFATGTTYKVKAYVTNDGGNTTLSDSYTLIPRSVTFNMNGHGSAPATQYVADGEKATQPAAPSADGWTFGGWYKEAGCTNVWNFNTETVSGGNKTIYAKWTQNASLSSIAITTQPTTTGYLVGETFSTTGAVVTATYSNSTTANVSASATWTPTTGLVAGSNTMTASYTEGGVTRTATTTVTGYTVTVNKKRQDGTTDLASGTASCSVRTLTATDGGNYKFWKWEFDGASNGLSIASTTSASTTLTGTPTGDVTIKAIYYDPITVAWKVGTGNASGGTTEVKYGTKISTLPTTPADNALSSCGTNKFMGWSTSEITTTGTNTPPADLFTAASGASNLTTNTTYHAVFANVSGGGGASAGTTMWGETWTGATTATIADGSANPSVYAQNGTTTYNSATVTYTESGDNVYCRNDNYAKGDASPELYIKSSNSWTASGIPTGGAATLTLTFVTNVSSLNNFTVSTTETGKTPSMTGSVTGSAAPYGYSYTITTDGASTISITFGNNANTRLDDILLVVATTSSSTTDYMTGCCNTLAAPANPGETPNSTGAVLTWDAVGSATGYEVKIDGGEWTSTGNGTTTGYTITGKACGGTSVSWQVRATGDGSTNCAKGAATTVRNFNTTSCACTGTYSFHYQHGSDWNTDNICFTAVTGATNNYLTDEMYLPYAEWYKVGWQGTDQSYTVAKGFTGTTNNIPMPFYHNRDKSFGANPQSGNIGGGKGRFHVYHDSGSTNKYVSFIPTGYTINFGTGDTWVNDLTLNFTGKTNAWDETEWYTELTTLTNAQIGKKIFVGLQTASGYVWCDPYSQKDDLSGLRTKSGSDSWVSGGMTTAYPNKTGKFRIYANSGDKNWYVTFVPHYQLTYDANGGTGSMSPLPATPVSCEETSVNRTVTVGACTFSAPSNKEFKEWNTQADGNGTTIAIGSRELTGDLKLYAIWKNATYSISATLTNVSSVTSFPVAYTYTGSAANVTYTFEASSGYRLPDNVTVTGSTYTWDKTTGELTLTGTITGAVSITISGTQTHTVTWLSNGSNYVSPVTYDHGASLTLPAGTPSAPGGCSSKTFVGWTSNATEISVEQHNAPTMLDPENLGTVTTNATYRAVFADGTSTTTYKWVRKEVNSSFSLSDVSEGQWALVTSDGHAFNGTMSSGHGQPTSGTVTFTNNEAASMPSGYCELTFTKVMDGNNIAGYTMYNSTYGYLYASKASSGGLDWHNSESSYWYYYGDNWRYNSNSATLRVYNNSFRTYNSSSNSTVWLAKKTSVTTSTWDNYVTICSSCTTPSDLAMSNITSTGGKVSWTGVSLSPTEGYKVAWNTSNSVPGTLDGTNSANVDADKSEYTISGLTPATRYYVFVQSKCNSTWSSSTNFYTNAKITYAPGTGGTGTMDPQEVTYNTNATAAANSFDPNTGKEFTGWLSNVAVTVNGGATPTTSVPAGATINSLTQAITLTAQWADIPQYTITFNVPSGFTAVSDIVKYRDETFNFPNVTMKAGLDCASFAGWVLGASYTTQTTFYQYNETSSPVTANATYTAVFYQEDGQSDATADQYELVTNVADLKAGEKYLIVGYKSSTTTYYALGMQNGNNRSGVAITVTDNKTQPTIATSTSSTDVYELTLGGSAGAWTFKDVSNTYLEANSGTQNYLRLSSTDDDKIKWVITIANDGLATIDTKYYSTEAGWHGTIFFNTTSNLFSCYEQNYASFPKVYLFKKGGANQYTTTANPSCAAKHNLSWTVDVAAGGAVKVNNQTSGPIEVREGNTVEAVVTSTTAGYQFNGWTWTTNTGGAVIASPSATTTDITMGTADAALKANFAVIQVTSLKFKALQTGESDKLGNNLTMSMYPGEGQASDPLEHTATVTLHEKLPATALAVLTSDFTWSVRVKASGAADWTNVSFSGNELGTNAVLQKYNKSNGTLQAKAAGVAEITVTANDGSGISAKVTITVADVPMSSMTVDPTSVTLYSSETGSNSDQNLVVVPITYTPNNATFSGTPYTQGSYTYVSTTASVASIQIQAKANVTAEHTETVTLTTKNTVPTTTGSALTATITVTVKPMPKVHFVDIVHGESFSDVVATVNPSDKTEVLFTKTTPTHAADWVSVSSDNTCETNAEHLVGWIWSEWEDVADYLDGSSSSKPGKSALETAGAGVWFTPGASINTQTYEGRTYYAVWAKTVVTP